MAKKMHLLLLLQIASCFSTSLVHGITRLESGTLIKGLLDVERKWKKHRSDAYFTYFLFYCDELSLVAVFVF